MTDPAQTIGGRQFIQPRAVPLSVVQTDAAYTTALTQRGIHTGSLADLFGGAPVVPAAQFFGAVVHQVTARGLDALNLTHDEVLEFGDWRYSPVPAGAPPGTLPQPWPSDLRRFGALKAGPLVGLWATGPFLHNGSVPTIDELLRRPEERRQVFWTGSRELDAERLGFVSDEAPGLFRFDTTLLGNGNGGHAFPATPLSSEERRAVLEYLKEPSRTFENVTLGR
jgi:hypothetical protein